jgi:hypothetical protein
MGIQAVRALPDLGQSGRLELFASWPDVVRHEKRNELRRAISSARVDFDQSTACFINECQAAFRKNHYRHPRRFTKRLRSSRMMLMTLRCGAFPRAIRRRGPLCALAHRVTRNVGPSASRRLRLVYVEWQPECKRRSTSQLACHCDVASERLRE